MLDWTCLWNRDSVCVVDEAGVVVVVLERRVATDPEAIAAGLTGLPAAPARTLLQTGRLTPWLWHELSARGLVVHCVDARRAKAQLALRRPRPTATMAAAWPRSRAWDSTPRSG
jgi:hypothetical protein